MTTTDWTPETTAEARYADVNGLHLYYELHGAGRPLVLLHGGLGSGEMFGPVVPLLAAGGYQVILPDLQGHGRTADIDRPLDIKVLADDIAELIRSLGHTRADVMGYSLGAGVALFTAVKHPELVRKVIVTSAYLRPDAVDPALLSQQAAVGAAAADMLKGTPMYDTYMRLAPNPSDFPKLLDKIGASMAVQYDYTEEVRGIQVPTLFAAGDMDQAPVRHYADIWDLLGGGHDGGWMGENRPKGGHALAILPGLQHYNAFASPLLAAVALSFLDAPEPPRG